jgi:2-iminobutanoate/2-iminopropanoate deaminase
MYALQRLVTSGETMSVRTVNAPASPRRPAFPRHHPQRLAYVAGLLPHVPGQAAPKPGTIEDQVRQVLANLDTVLKAVGSDRTRVLRVTAFVSDVSHWPTVNRVWAEFFGEHKPARCVVPVNELHYGYAIEIETTAACD